MNISTSMGIGLAKKLAPNFEYTWAWDASKQTSLDEVSAPSGYNVTLVNGGININYSASRTDPIAFGETDFTSGSTSGGSGSAAVPDGAASATAAGAVGHPGRYFSTIATVHSMTVADGTLNELFGSSLVTSSGGQVFNITSLGSDPSHVNGHFRFDAPGVVYNPGISNTDANGDLAMPQSEIDEYIVGKTVAVTYDLSVGYYNASPSSDITELRFYPAWGKDVNINATVHGFILSNVPPIIHHLPVEIDNSTF